MIKRVDWTETKAKDDVKMRIATKTVSSCIRQRYVLLRNTQYFYSFVNNYLSGSLRKRWKCKILLSSWSFLRWIAQHCIFFFRCYSVYFCISVTLSSRNFHPKIAATLPKRHLVAVTLKVSEFRLLVFYPLWRRYCSAPCQKQQVHRQSGGTMM